MVCISVVSAEISPFSFLILFFLRGFLSFLFGEPGQKFVDFVYPFKEPALGFIDFFSIVLF